MRGQSHDAGQEEVKPLWGRLVAAGGVFAVVSAISAATWGAAVLIGAKADNDRVDDVETRVLTVERRQEATASEEREHRSVQQEQMRQVLELERRNADAVDWIKRHLIEDHERKR